MKISFKRKKEPELNSIRNISKFLWFPLIIDDELRWLETVYIEQKYWIPNYCKNPKAEWINMNWIG